MKQRRMNPAVWLVVSAAFFVACLAPAQARAEQLETFVEGVVPPIEEGEDTTLILLSHDGRVLRLGADEAAITAIDQMTRAAQSRQALRITFAEVGPVHVIHEIENIREITLDPEAERGPVDPFGGAPWKGELPPLDEEAEAAEPSTRGAQLQNRSVEGPLLAGPPQWKPQDFNLGGQTFYDHMKSRGLRRGAQCFHRAYVWAWDIWSNWNIQTRKVFLFFTFKYIRRYNYNWWFHVAPYIETKDGEMVLDPTYLRKSVDMKTWTDNFLTNDPVCPTISQYTGHTKLGNKEWCYLRKTTMYYYHPNMIEAADVAGESLKEWYMDGLKMATRASRPSRQ